MSVALKFFPFSFCITCLIFIRFYFVSSMMHYLSTLSKWEKLCETHSDEPETTWAETEGTLVIKWHVPLKWLREITGEVGESSRWAHGNPNCFISWVYSVWELGGTRANSKMLGKKSTVHFCFDPRQNFFFMEALSSKNVTFKECYLQRMLSPTIRLFQLSCCSVEQILLLFLWLLLLFAHF